MFQQGFSKYSETVNKAFVGITFKQPDSELD